ncbi:tRNA dihydrouridine(20/20a) synthase DusA [Thiocystis minor]|uniref:tRNA dihydrouridine(20/20a) synthase DusA n=1 Tax=Thiocystis minor TaxID=61597 RepID=UPI001911BDFC|nr:tRNA dihydrouridine(20/20a) synthase DusA [Thiocystis minor]MBK5966912.1 tRNA dihydrouridine(20/20a) synthase DusA [Thiocystis minor]
MPDTSNRVATPLTQARQLSIAPMLDWTDRHFRFFLRLITRHSLLYTEMVTTGALLHGDQARFLRFDPAEHPVALQLGGSDPVEMARCARLGADWGYDEININVGCPSDRVQNGRFGACLMAEPGLVADCVAAMKDAVAVPVTVKTRIGIDDRDSYGELVDFVGTQAAAGCDALIVHARKAWLKGLSPKENRDVPPLRYEVVQQLKADFSDLSISLNGGIKTLTEAADFLTTLDGVMIGREAYHNPWMLAQADRVIFGDDHPPLTRHEVLERFLPYAKREMAAGVPLSAMSRHLLGLFQGQPGGRVWRRRISENAHRPGAGIDVLTDAAPTHGQPDVLTVDPSRRFAR